jgi:hypothetical protein
MKKTIFICLFLFAGISVQAQYFKDSYVDAAVSLGSQQFGGSLSWYKLHGLGEKKKFKIGYGLRFTTFHGTDLEYITAPANITSKSQSIAALFTETIEANLDTLLLQKPSTYFLNASIHLQYDPFEKFGVGFNIDALGVTFGNKQNGTYTSNKKTSLAPSTPTAFNALLISDSDRGSLNSEFYLVYRLSNKIALRAAYTFLFSEYTTDQKVQTFPEPNDRFRTKASMFTVGISFRPFMKGE